MVDPKTIKEGFGVGSAFLALLASMVPIIQAADSAWEQERILHSIIVAMAAPVGGNLDIPVVFIVGILSAWFSLFLLDATKRIQAVFILAAVGLILIPSLTRLNRILGSIALQPAVFTFGIVTGLTVGVGFGSLYGVKHPSHLGLMGLLKWTQFPAASGGLYYAIITLVGVTAVQYPFIAGVSIIDAIVVFVATFVGILALTVFVSYDYQNRIVTIAPSVNNGKYGPYVVGGLYEHAKETRHGFPIEGDAELVNAANAMSMEMLADRFHNLPVTFGYLSGGLFTRTAIIESDGWFLENINERTLQERLKNKPMGQSLLIKGWRRLKYYGWSLIPSPIRSKAEYTDGTVLNRIDHADTVLLLAPTPENEDEKIEIPAQKYADICRLYEDDVRTDVVVTTIEARPVANNLEDGITLNGYFRLEVGERLGISEIKVQNHACEVVPVDRFNEETPEGFDVLLDKVS